MRNASDINILAKLLMKTGENIVLLSENADRPSYQESDLTKMYESMLLDELTHIQIVTLELTKRLAGKTGEGEDISDTEEEGGERRISPRDDP